MYSAVHQVKYFPNIEISPSNSPFHSIYGLSLGPSSVKYWPLKIMAQPCLLPGYSYFQLESVKNWLQEETFPGTQYTCIVLYFGQSTVPGHGVTSFRSWSSAPGPETIVSWALWAQNQNFFMKVWTLKYFGILGKRTQDSFLPDTWKYCLNCGSFKSGFERSLCSCLRKMIMYETYPFRLE